jgi:Flp pilus assembly pilin Flp
MASRRRFGLVGRAFMAAEGAASVFEYALLGVLIATVVAIAGLTIGNTISSGAGSAESCGTQPASVNAVGTKCQSGGSAVVPGIAPAAPDRRVGILQRLAAIGRGTGGEGAGARTVMYGLLAVFVLTVVSIVGLNRGRVLSAELRKVEAGVGQPPAGPDGAA